MTVSELFRRLGLGDLPFPPDEFLGALRDRVADLAVADDAEIEGRPDVALELRSRHLGRPGALALAVADEYRRQLGLWTWGEWRAHAAVERELWWSHLHPRDRREPRGSGRSTRAALETFALAAVTGAICVVVVNNSYVGRQNDRYLLTELLDRLRLQIRVHVLSGQRHQPPRPHVVFRDHWQGDR